MKQKKLWTPLRLRSASHRNTNVTSLRGRNDLSTTYYLENSRTTSPLFQNFIDADCSFNTHSRWQDSHLCLRVQTKGMKSSARTSWMKGSMDSFTNSAFSQKASSVWLVFRLHTGMLSQLSLVTCKAAKCRLTPFKRCYQSLSWKRVTSCLVL